MAFVHILFYIFHMVDSMGKDRRRGRGATYNPPVRYDKFASEDFDDGWDIDDPLPPFRTIVTDEVPRSAITKNASPDLSFDRTLNPYRGCEHGCIYCYARPSHAYLGLSPGMDFETKLIARPQIAQVLERELAKRRYRCAPIAIGSNTDPYQPVEKDRKIMRSVLEVLSAYRHPVLIITKGTLIERDIDILSDMAKDGLVRVGVSVTTLDPHVSRVMEPRVPHPARRLRTIERRSAAGIDVRVMASPVIPALTDHELEAILAAGAEAGAKFASYITLRLPQEVAPLFAAWLQEAFPLRADRVMARVRETQGGKDYDPEFGKRMTGQGRWAELLKQRFQLACRKHGLSRELPDLRSDLFQVPPKPGDQMSLF
jgi:DNA repair photolyase